jgi:hypothetical protein
MLEEVLIGSDQARWTEGPDNFFVIVLLENGRVNGKRATKGRLLIQTQKNLSKPLTVHQGYLRQFEKYFGKPYENEIQIAACHQKS